MRDHSAKRQTVTKLKLITADGKGRLSKGVAPIWIRRDQAKRLGTFCKVAYS